MTDSIYTSCSRFVKLLLLTLAASALLTGAGTFLQAQEHSDTRGQFVELDGEIQAIKQEILEINREMLLLEESSLYPGGPQLVVLVSMAADTAISPEQISLQLDGQLLTQHEYSHSEALSLRGGGVHRLFTGALDPGEHVLDVSLSGQLDDDQPFTRERNATITMMSGRKTMELHLDSGERGSPPQLTVREWQQ